MTQKDRIMKYISFKHTTTGETKSYMTDILWTIRQFMIIIKLNVIRDFNTDEFDIVTSGQNREEHGNALIESNETLRNQFGNNNISFYIRPSSTL